jgi:hypothetical protein
MTADEFVNALEGFQSREELPRGRPDPVHLRDVAEQANVMFSSYHTTPAIVAFLQAIGAPVPDWAERRAHA